jgi:hypothetical protein
VLPGSPREVVDAHVVSERIRHLDKGEEGQILPTVQHLGDPCTGVSEQLSETGALDVLPNRGPGGANPSARDEMEQT